MAECLSVPGRVLVDRLAQLAAERGHHQVWVATGDDAVGFYQRCGWAPVQRLRLHSTGIDTTILTRVGVTSRPRRLDGLLRELRWQG